MALRTVCLCEGKLIGIETIFTVINGQQINIPDKLKNLRFKSKNNQLFCPCGCGSNLILVAGDKNLREQHFRLKKGELNNNCHAIVEGKHSIDSKIVLKCWLDDKLRDKHIESRVPINEIEDIHHKYEFTFLSRKRKTALSYCYERSNLSDEKFEVLESNSQGINIIYIVDGCNSGTRGQYPEWLMKIQDRQGYCLYLYVQDSDYFKAELKATVYVKNIDGLWQEISLAHGAINNYEIDDRGNLLFRNDKIFDLLEKAKTEYEQQMEKKRIEEEKTKEEFQKMLDLNADQQDAAVGDVQRNRLLKCEFCGKIGKESDFCCYGGVEHINDGICYECFRNNPDVKKKSEKKVEMVRKKHEANICPNCGGVLKERSGRYGRFMGCSNYPKCRFTRKIKI